MTLDNDLDSSGAEGLGGSAERALNDVGLSIGFSMMVLLVVVVSSMTALRDIAVNLPDVKRSEVEEADMRAPVVVALTLEADEDGNLRAARMDGAPLDLGVPLTSRLKTVYADRFAGAEGVSLRVRADGALSHKTVSEAVFAMAAALRSLGGGRRVAVRYVAREAD